MNSNLFKKPAEILEDENASYFERYTALIEVEGIEPIGLPMGASQELTDKIEAARRAAVDERRAHTAEELALADEAGDEGVQIGEDPEDG